MQRRRQKHYLVALIWILFLVLIGVQTNNIATAQDFPNGLIAYIPDIEEAYNRTNRIVIFDPNTETSSEIKIEDGYVQSVSWSPNQEYLLYYTLGYVEAHIIHFQTGEVVSSFEFLRNDRGLREVWHDWHPSLPRIAFIYDRDPSIDKSQYTIQVYDVVEQQWISELIEPEFIQPHFLEWSPDGENILFRVSIENSYWQAQYYLFNVANNTYRFLLEHNSLEAHWANDGQQLVMSSGEPYESQIEVVNIATGNREIIFQPENASIGNNILWVLNDTALVFYMETFKDSDPEYVYQSLNLLLLDSGRIQDLKYLTLIFSDYDLSADKAAILSNIAGYGICIVNLTTYQETCFEDQKGNAQVAWSN